jgi:aminoglycoside 6'-N-acetyltransferase
MTAEILAATEHLALRRMTNDDAAALATYRSDPVQARYQSWETPYPLDSARALIAQMRNVRFAQPGVWLQIGIETSGTAHRRHRGPPWRGVRAYGAR